MHIIFYALGTFCKQSLLYTTDNGKHFSLKRNFGDRGYQNCVKVKMERVSPNMHTSLLLDFSLTVKAATLIFISRCGSAILSAKEGKSGFI